MNRTLLIGARVVTMADTGPAWAEVDVLVEDDRISAVGPDLDRTGSEVVDVADRVIIPGLVNAHLHTWQSALRCLGVDWTLLDYLVHVHDGVASHYGPDDLYAATRFGALSQIACGTTTLGDWSHNLTSPADVDAALAGLTSSGIRAVFFDGSGYREHGPHPLSDIDRIRDHLAGGGLVTAGLAIKGPQYSSVDDALTDLRAAAERDLVVSMHHSGGEAGPSWAAAVDAGLVGPSTNVVHGGGLTHDWVRRLSDRGVTFTLTPESELRMGPAAVISDELLSQGITPSLGTDVDTVVPGEILTSARILLSHQRGIEHARLAAGELGDDARASTAAHALRWATVEGARALGLDDHVGRIQPGMQADLVVIDTTSPALWPAHDPVAAALHANVGDIEAVMIAGRWRKRSHRLVDVDHATLRADIAESAHRIFDEAERDRPRRSGHGA